MASGEKDDLAAKLATVTNITRDGVDMARAMLHPPTQTDYAGYTDADNNPSFIANADLQFSIPPPTNMDDNDSWSLAVLFNPNDPQQPVTYIRTKNEAFLGTDLICPSGTYISLDANNQPLLDSEHDKEVLKYGHVYDVRAPRFEDDSVSAFRITAASITTTFNCPEMFAKGICYGSSTATILPTTYSSGLPYGHDYDSGLPTPDTQTDLQDATSNLKLMIPKNRGYKWTAASTEDRTISFLSSRNLALPDFRTIGADETEFVLDNTRSLSLAFGLFGIASTQHTASTLAYNGAPLGVFNISVNSAYKPPPPFRPGDTCVVEQIVFNPLTRIFYYKTAVIPASSALILEESPELTINKTFEQYDIGTKFKFVSIDDRLAIYTFKPLLSSSWRKVGFHLGEMQRWSQDDPAITVDYIIKSISDTHVSVAFIDDNGLEVIDTLPAAEAWPIVDGAPNIDMRIHHITATRLFAETNDRLTQAYSVSHTTMLALAEQPYCLPGSYSWFKSGTEYYLDYERYTAIPYLTQSKLTVMPNPPADWTSSFGVSDGYTPRCVYAMPNGTSAIIGSEAAEAAFGMGNIVYTFSDNGKYVHFSAAEAKGLRPPDFYEGLLPLPIEYTTERSWVHFPDTRDSMRALSQIKHHSAKKGSFQISKLLDVKNPYITTYPNIVASNSSRKVEASGSLMFESDATFSNFDPNGAYVGATHRRVSSALPGRTALYSHTLRDAENNYVQPIDPSNYSVFTGFAIDYMEAIKDSKFGINAIRNDGATLDHPTIGNVLRMLPKSTAWGCNVLLYKDMSRQTTISFKVCRDFEMLPKMGSPLAALASDAAKPDLLAVNAAVAFLNVVPVLMEEKDNSFGSFLAKVASPLIKAAGPVVSTLFPPLAPVVLPASQAVGALIDSTQNNNNTNDQQQHAVATPNMHNDQVAQLQQMVMQLQQQLSQAQSTPSKGRNMRPTVRQAYPDRNTIRRNAAQGNKALGNVPARPGRMHM